MKIVVVGGTGTIGRRLAAKLHEHGHLVITAGRTSGDVRVDLTSPESIETMYQQVGAVDAVVSAAAHGPMDDFTTLSRPELIDNMQGKLFGQVDLVLIGQDHVADGASFTLTSGVFADQAWPGVTGGAMISGALHAFVLSAAVELPRTMRINAVSPTMISDSVETFSEYFPGMRPVSMDSLLTDYLSCIHGEQTGEIIRAYG